jgi:hypothetical protein
MAALSCSIPSTDDGSAPHGHGAIILDRGALPHPLPTAAAAPFPISTALHVWLSVTGNRPWALDPCRTDVAVAVAVLGMDVDEL